VVISSIEIGCFVRNAQKNGLNTTNVKSGPTITHNKIIFVIIENLPPIGSFLISLLKIVAACCFVTTFFL
jgi:hypothetical protein